MRSVIGILLLGISFTGTFYFRRYHGKMITHPGVWYSFCLIIGMVGAWCIFSVRKSKLSKAMRAREDAAADFVKNAERIPIQIDNCDFKNAGYQQEFVGPNLEMLEPAELQPFFTLRLPDSHSAGIANIKKTGEMTRSYLVYRMNTGGLEHTFISQAFPFDYTTLEFHVMNKDVSLYADRFDKSRYLFVLTR